MKAHEYAKFFTAASEMGKKFLAVAEQEPDAEVLVYSDDDPNYESVNSGFLLLTMRDLKVDEFVEITEIFKSSFKRYTYMPLQEYELRSRDQYDHKKFSVKKIKAIVVGII